MAVVLNIPERIKGKGLLPFLSLLGSADGAASINLDFSHLRLITPAGMVALTSYINRWRAKEKEVAFSGLERCKISSYLQRMDVFSACNIPHNDASARHDHLGKFVPVRPITHNVDEIGTEVASCIAPGGEEYEHPLAELHSLAFYVLTETANNVRQHSRGQGFTAAQVSGNDGLVKIALADNGRGILRSFQDAEFAWSHGLSHGDAIAKALESRISSCGAPRNEGVGLTLVSGLARLMNAWLLIVSGDGVLQISPSQATLITTLPKSGTYNGTLIGLTFDQKAVYDFPDLLERAKVEAGLLRNAMVRINFKS